MPEYVADSEPGAEHAIIMALIAIADELRRLTAAVERLTERINADDC